MRTRRSVVTIAAALACACGDAGAPRELSTQGGATLADLWGGPDAKAAIAKGGWTHVVLQEQSETPPCDAASFYQYAGLFAGAIRQAGAKTAFYET